MRCCDSPSCAASTHRLCMLGAGNTDVCLRPRRVPGLRTVGATLRPCHLLHGALLHTDYTMPLVLVAPRCIPRHRQPELNIDHSVPDTATSTRATPSYSLCYFKIDTKGYHLAWATYLASTPVTTSAMHRPLRLWWGCSPGPPLDSSPISPSVSLPL